MNISEIERKTGLTRANVRFYEKENLLNPIRTENGYRNYSEEDAGLLLKIRLMRELGISIGEIRKLQNEEADLDSVLAKRIQQIHTEQEKLHNSEVICQNIRQARTTYQELDAAYYLKELENGPKPAIRKDITKWDVLPVKKYPFRRFFARSFDFAFYQVMIYFFGYVILHNRQTAASSSTIYNIFFSLAACLLMLLFEPLLLSIFAATPGKWIFGIRILNKDERRLSYIDALSRTIMVLLYGQGLQIPLVTIYFHAKSYFAYTKDEHSETELPWEEDSICTFRDGELWRCIAYVMAQLLLIFLAVLFTMVSLLPKHRGDLTPEEFVENFNAYYYHPYESAWKLVLDKESQRFLFHSDEENHVQYNFDLVSMPEFIYTLDNDLLQSISCEYTADELSYGYYPEIPAAVFAFAGAQKHLHALNFTELSELMKYVENHYFESFEFTNGDINVTCDVEIQGYDLPYDEENPRSYTVKFSMTKIR